MPSLVAISAFTTDIFLKLQADDISDHFNLLRFAKLGRSLGVLHLVSATVPLRFWLWTRLQGAV
jgi:hypothetical protein